MINILDLTPEEYKKGKYYDSDFRFHHWYVMQHHINEKEIRFLEFILKNYKDGKIKVKEIEDMNVEDVALKNNFLYNKYQIISIENNMFILINLIKGE